MGWTASFMFPAPNRATLPVALALAPADAAGTPDVREMSPMVNRLGGTGAVTGLLAGVLGLAALALFIFGPSYATETSYTRGDGTTGTIHGTMSALQMGLDPLAAVFLAVLAACSISVAAGAYLYGRAGTRGPLILLRTCAGLLVLGVVLGIASIGIPLLPSAVLAVIAATTAGRTRPRGRSTA